jgi:hypothetical protein
MWNALQLRETLTTARLWSDDFVLVMNSHSLGMLRQYKQSVKHLHDERRIVWLQESLTEEEFNSLVAASFCHVCLYSSENQNEYWAGKSSGKAMRSLLFGVPILCSNYPSFSFVREHGLGIGIDHPLDIPAALDRLKDGYDGYAARCREYARASIDPRREYEAFRAKFLGATPPHKPACDARDGPQILHAWQFYPEEISVEGDAYRWMGPSGQIKLKNLGCDMTLKLRLAVPLENLSAPPDVRIEFNGQMLSETARAPGSIEVTRDIGVASQGAGTWSDLRIRTTGSFIPRDVVPASTDPRRLGLILQRLTWHPKQGSGSSASPPAP